MLNILLKLVWKHVTGATSKRLTTTDYVKESISMSDAETEDEMGTMSLEQDKKRHNHH